MAKKKYNQPAGKAGKKNEMQKNSWDQEIKRNHQKVNPNSASSSNFSGRKPVRENNYSGSKPDHSAKTNAGKVDSPLMKPVTGVDSHAGSVKEQEYTGEKKHESRVNFRTGESYSNREKSYIDSIPVSKKDKPESGNSFSYSAENQTKIHSGSAPEKETTLDVRESVEKHSNSSQKEEEYRSGRQGGGYNIPSPDREISKWNESMSHPRTEKKRGDSYTSPYDRQEENSFQNDNNRMETSVDKQESSVVREHSYDLGKQLPEDDDQKRQGMREYRENFYAGNLHTEHSPAEEKGYNEGLSKYERNHTPQYHPRDLNSGQKSKEQIPMRKSEEKSPGYWGKEKDEKQFKEEFGMEMGKNENPIPDSKKRNPVVSGNENRVISEDFSVYPYEKGSVINHSDASGEKRLEQLGKNENSDPMLRNRNSSLASTGSETGQKEITNSYQNESGIRSEFQTTRVQGSDNPGQKSDSGIQNQEKQDRFKNNNFYETGEVSHPDESKKIWGENVKNQSLDGYGKKDDFVIEYSGEKQIEKSGERKSDEALIQNSGQSLEGSPVKSLDLSSTARDSEHHLKEHKSETSMARDEDMKTRILEDIGKKNSEEENNQSRRSVFSPDNAGKYRDENFPAGGSGAPRNENEKYQFSGSNPDTLAEKKLSSPAFTESGNKPVSPVDQENRKSFTGSPDHFYEEERKSLASGVKSQDEQIKDQILDNLKTNNVSLVDERRENLKNENSTEVSSINKFAQKEFKSGNVHEEGILNEEKNNFLSGGQNRTEDVAPVKVSVHSYEESVISPESKRNEQIKDEILENAAKKEEFSMVGERRETIKENEPMRGMVSSSDADNHHSFNTSQENTEKNPVLNPPKQQPDIPVEKEVQKSNYSPHVNGVVFEKQGVSEKKYQESQEIASAVDKRDQQMKEQILNTASRQAGSQNLSDNARPENQVQARENLGGESAPIQHPKEIIPPNGTHSGAIQEEIIHESSANGKNASSGEESPERGSVHAMKDHYGASELHLQSAPVPGEKNPSSLEKTPEKVVISTGGRGRDEQVKEEILNRARNTTEEEMTPVRQNPERPQSSIDGRNPNGKPERYGSSGQSSGVKSGPLQEERVFNPIKNQKPEEIPNQSDGKSEDIKDEILKRAQNQETEEIVDMKVSSGRENLPEDNKVSVGASIQKDDLFKQVGQFVTENQKVSVFEIQKKFQVNFTQAVQILGQLEQKGVITSSDRLKPREVLMNPVQFQEVLHENQPSTDKSVKGEILRRAAQADHSEEITPLRQKLATPLSPTGEENSKACLDNHENDVSEKNEKSRILRDSETEVSEVDIKQYSEENSDLLNEKPDHAKDEILKRAQNQEAEEIVNAKGFIGHENGSNVVPVGEKFEKNVTSDSRDETVKDEILNRAAQADPEEELVGQKRGLIHTDEDQKDDLSDSEKPVDSDEQIDSDPMGNLDSPDESEKTSDANKGFPDGEDMPPDVQDEIVDASEKTPQEGKRPKLSVSAAAVIAGAARKLKFDDGDNLNPFSRFNSGKFREDEEEPVEDSDSPPSPSGYFNPDDPDVMEDDSSGESKEDGDTPEDSEMSEKIFNPEDPVSPEDILEDLSKYQPSDITFKLSSRMEITTRQFTGHFYRMAAKGDVTKKEFDKITSGSVTAALIIAERMKKFAAKGQQNLMMDRLNGTLTRLGLNPLTYVPRNVADLNLILKDLNSVLVKNGYKPLYGSGTRMQILIGKMLRHGGLSKDVEDALKAMQEVAKNKTLLEGHHGMRNVTRMVKMKARMYLQQCEMGRGLFFITDTLKYTKDALAMGFRVVRTGAAAGRMASRLALKKSLQAAVKLSRLNSTNRAIGGLSRAAESYAKNASEFAKKQQVKRQKKIEKRTRLEQKMRDPFGLRAKRHQLAQKMKTKIMNRIPSRVKNNKFIKFLAKIRDKLATLFSGISTLFAALKHYLFLGLLIFLLFAIIYAIVSVLLTSIAGVFDAGNVDEDIRVKILEQIQTCYNEQLEYIEGLNSQYDEVHVVFNDVKDLEKYEDPELMPHEAFLETTNSAEILSMALVYFDYNLDDAKESEVLSYVRQLYNGSHQLTVQSKSEIIGFDEDTEESIEWTTAEVTLTTYYFDSIFDSMLSDSSISTPILKGGSVEYQVWYYFRKLGFSEEVVAGILGNAQQESSMNPYNNDPWAIGLFQFETGYLEDPPCPPDYPAQILKKMAAERGIDWTDLQVQLDCVMSMLPSDFETYTGKTHTYDNGTVTWWPEKMTLEEFKVIDDVSLATQIFCRVHERPSKPQMNNRISYAQSFYKKFKGTNVDGSEIINEAMKYIGCPYVWSGGHEEGLTDYDLTQGADCSGFVYWVLKKTGYYDGTSCPISDNFANLGEPVGSIEEAMPGDVIVWKGHVGFYMGNDEVVHAANPDAGIKTTKGVNAAGGGKKLLGIRRFHKIQ